MSKWADEFCDKYGTAGELKRITREINYEKGFNERMKTANKNITKITRNKLGKRL